MLVYDIDDVRVFPIEDCYADKTLMVAQLADPDILISREDRGGAKAFAGANRYDY